MPTEHDTRTVGLGTCDGPWRFYAAIVVAMAVLVMGLVLFVPRGAPRVLVTVGFIGVMTVIGRHALSTRIELRARDEILAVRPYGFLGAEVSISRADMIGAEVELAPRPRLKILRRGNGELVLGPWGHLSTSRHLERLEETAVLLRQFGGGEAERRTPLPPA